MARFYEPKGGMLCLNFEACEETVFADAFERVRGRISRADHPWFVELENFYLNLGTGVSKWATEAMNVQLRRLGLPELEFKETHVYEFGRNPNHAWKAEYRTNLIKELAQMEPARRQQVVADAKAKMAELPPPHHTWAEHKADRERVERENERSRVSVAARLMAEAKKRNEPEPVPAPADDAAEPSPSEAPNGRFSRKLTEEDARAIYQDDRTGSQIAAEYGITSGLVYNIKNGRAWKTATRDLGPAAWLQPHGRKAQVAGPASNSNRPEPVPTQTTQATRLDADTALLLLENTDEQDVRNDIIRRLDLAGRKAVLGACSEQALKRIIVRSILAATAH